MTLQSLQDTRIWIIDDDQSIRWVLEKALGNAGAELESFESASKALTVLKRQPESAPQTILCDVRMPGIDGYEFLRQVKKVNADLPIIIMTAYSDLESTVQAYQDGAFEYLAKPFDISEVIELAQRACEKKTDKPRPNAVEEEDEDEEIIGDSAAMQEVYRVIGRLSRSSINVLIEGETGTGKETIARAIHRHSPRASAPFVAVNAAAMPQDQLEIELFGQEITGNDGNTQVINGRLEQSSGGALFIDEVGELTPLLQTRLMQAQAQGEIYRVGGHTAVKVDLRILSASHQDMKSLAAAGRLREDFYHSLKVMRLVLPPLRQRPEDIPLLVRHFLRQIANEMRETPKVVRPEVRDHLTQLPWPGNIRQVENACRWFSVMASGKEIELTDLPEDLSSIDVSTAQSAVLGNPLEWHKSLELWASKQLQEGREDLLSEASPLFERTLLECALAASSGRKKDAAKRLGWGRNTLTRKLKELYRD